MEIIVGFLLLILAVFLVGQFLAFLGLLFQLAPLIISSYLIFVLLVSIFIYAYSSRKLSKLKRDDKLSKVVEATVDQSRIVWTINHEAAESYANPEFVGFMCFIVCAFSLYISTKLFYDYGAFNNLVWEVFYEDFSSSVMPNTGLFVATGSIFFLNMVTLGQMHPILKGKKAVVQRIENAVEKINQRTNDKIAQLEQTEIQSRRYAKDIDVRLPEMFIPNLRSYVSQNRSELISDDKPLNDYLVLLLKEASEQKRKLEQCREVHFRNLQEYKDASLRVNSCGSQSLLRILDEIYRAGLGSTNLKQLILESKWDDFISISDEIRASIQQVKNNAIRYSRGDRDVEPERVEKMDESRACTILGIPKNATPEQIKKIYRQLAALWHPDTKLASTDAKFKELNEAYEFLKKTRKFN